MEMKNWKMCSFQGLIEASNALRATHFARSGDQIEFGFRKSAPTKMATRGTEKLSSRNGT
jgi:hypothetical protein